MSEAGAVPPAGAHPQARVHGPRDLPAATAAPAPVARPEHTTCAKCGGSARRPRDCEHTGWKTYCTECYVELHYYLTEPGAEGS